MNPKELPLGTGVAVYGASSSLIDPQYLDAARRMGALVARAGLPLVCGGGAGGVMAAAIEGAASCGGQTIGVLPQFMIDKGWAHASLGRCIATDSMHSRKLTMASLSRAAVAMAGGIGTLDELAEMMTWSQLGIFAGEVIIVNTADFYAPLIEMLRRMCREGFMRGDVIPATIVSTPEEAIERILRPSNATIPNA